MTLWRDSPAAAKAPDVRQRPGLATPLKTLPTIIASASNNLALELTAFDAVDRIPNRDATGYYYNVRLQPQGEEGRLAVLFSGTVMAVRPEAFGLPTQGDRDSTLRTFAEAAIGDSLDDDGLPPFTPGGVSATKIECFSPHIQAWRDRPRATDAVIEAYLFAHVIHSWKYGHQSWTLGPSDSLRLNQSLEHILRIVRLYEGDAWSVKGGPKVPYCLAPTPSFLRQQVSKKTPPPLPTETDPVAPEQAPADFIYVDASRIAELRTLENATFDLRKLLALCEELNQCYRAQCYHAVAALNRALIDHVAPVFGFRTFAEVANNYAGTKSFKDLVTRLQESARKIADTHLHTPMRDSEVLPTRVQVNFSNEVDHLLGEIIRILQKPPP